MDQGNITQLIDRWQAGEEAALESLTPFVYDELKRIARKYMNQESVGHTLQATALVNEAFLQLAGAKINYSDRSHFLATAARMMRRTLVDHARSKSSQKRGSGRKPVSLDEDAVRDATDTAQLLEMDIALTRLEQHDAQMASVIELIFFGGLTYEETARTLGMTRSALHEDLVFAKAWLKKEMT